MENELSIKQVQGILEIKIDDKEIPYISEYNLSSSAQNGFISLKLNLEIPLDLFKAQIEN